MSILTFAVTRLRTVSAISEYVSLGVAAIFLGAALWRIGRDRSALEHFGISLGGLLAPPDESKDAGPLGLYDFGRLLRDNAVSIARETGVALALCLLVFPPFLLAFGFWHETGGLPAWDPPPNFGAFILAQVIVVGLPEEAFFRGYVQTRLGDAAPTAEGARIPIRVHVLLTQALLFALVHFIVDFDPTRLAVFFPALLFGLLRAWRGGIGAAILFHAACNIYSDLLFRGWVNT